MLDIFGFYQIFPISLHRNNKLTNGHKKSCRTICQTLQISSIANIRQFFFSAKGLTNKINY